MKHYIGIDIGSTCAKTVVCDETGAMVHSFVQPTGWSSVDTANAIGEKLLSLGIAPEETPCVATGYGRVAVPFANKSVTEISCHGRGACEIHKADDLVVIDIGGQDTKIISVTDGMVSDFIMNDKCSAGTGRFLEVMANTLSISPQALCELAAKGGGVTISSMCTVFAESEVISLIGQGQSKENIAFAVVDSIVTKVASQAKRMQIEGRKLCLTGGLCECDYIVEALSNTLHAAVETNPQGRYAGAIGAALYAMKLK